MNSLKDHIVARGDAPSQLPVFYSLFVAKAVSLLNEPHHELYVPVHQYFMSEARTDLNSIPMLGSLLNGGLFAKCNHKVWFLSTLEASIRSSTSLDPFYKRKLWDWLETASHSLATSSLDSKQLLYVILGAICSLATVPELQRTTFSSSMLPFLHRHVGSLGKSWPDLCALLAISQACEVAFESARSPLEKSHLSLIIWCVASHLQVLGVRVQDQTSIWMGILSTLAHVDTSRRTAEFALPMIFEIESSIVKEAQSIEYLEASTSSLARKLPFAVPSLSNSSVGLAAILCKVDSIPYLYRKIVSTLAHHHEGMFLRAVSTFGEEKAFLKRHIIDN
jgi:hypothetical protein